MKYYFYIFALISGLGSFGCSNCDATKYEYNLEKQTQNIHAAAKEKFNSKYKIINNQSDKYAIVLKSIQDAKSPVIDKQTFFIYEFESNEIVFEDEIINGNVFWETDKLVTVTRIPGMIKKDSEKKLGNKVYSFNVLTKEKF